MTVVTVPSVSKNITRCGGSIPIRTVIWIMVFTCTLVLYILRTNMSLIILAMVDSGSTNSSSIPECKAGDTNLTNPYNETIVAEKQTSSHMTKHGTTFDWDSKLQGLILGAYFWGFVLSNIPGAAIAEKFGPRKSIAVSFTVSSLMTLLGPLGAKIHPHLLIASRFFIGLFGGIVYPAVHCLIAQWAPPAEKGKFISATLGSSLGTVITWPLLGM